MHARKMYSVDDTFKSDKVTVSDMLKRGLLYQTKEDKIPYKKDSKVFIEKDKSTKTMYYIKKGNQILDRLNKTKAIELMEQLNGVS